MSTHVIGTLNIQSGNFSDLKLSDTLIIETTGYVNNMGSIENVNAAGASKNFIINGNGTYIHNPYNNVIADESIFIYCAESFSNTSNITIAKWFDLSIPVGSPTRVAISNFGNLTLSVPTPGNRWNQKGYFSVNRIKGLLTITDGVIIITLAGKTCSSKCRTEIDHTGRRSDARCRYCYILTLYIQVSQRIFLRIINKAYCNAGR